uniref:ADF-H domain-containing protein n=1 Tax=Panagrolaimus davidi TaxID=227884 RepID=A0A914P4G5_9BILA
MFNNMGSGVFVNADCQSAFRQLSAGSLRYIIYKIEGKGVVIDTAKSDDDIGVDTNDYENNSKEAYEAFIKDLKNRTDGFTDCRYAVFDFKFACNRPGAGTSKMDKIVFIQLCPDGASIKKKMVYASSASAIKSSLGSEKILQFQVTDESEIAHKELVNKLSEKFLIFK